MRFYDTDISYSENGLGYYDGTEAEALSGLGQEDYYEDSWAGESDAFGGDYGGGGGSFDYDGGGGGFDYGDYSGGVDYGAGGYEPYEGEAPPLEEYNPYEEPYEYPSITGEEAYGPSPDELAAEETGLTPEEEAWLRGEDVELTPEEEAWLRGEGPEPDISRRTGTPSGGGGMPSGGGGGGAPRTPTPPRMPTRIPTRRRTEPIRVTSTAVAPRTAIGQQFPWWILLAVGGVILLSTRKS